VSGHVEVQNLPTSVFNDEEAVQHLEGHRGYGEEVERSDHLPVIPEEGQPSLARITAAPNPLQIPGYGSFGDNEAQFLECSMDPGRSPGRILFGQAADECPNFGSSFRSVSRCSRLPLPEESKSRPMPADDCLWFDRY
jgi:hypothetical protein